MRRGDVYYVDFGRPPERVGSEQYGLRPAVIIQNDVGNQHSPTTIVAALTSRIDARRLPVNVDTSRAESGLRKDGRIMLSQLMTVDRRRLGRFVGRIPVAVMDRVDVALKVSLALS